MKKDKINITVETHLKEEDVAQAILLLESYVDLVQILKHLSDTFEDDENKIGLFIEALIALKHFVESDRLILQSNTTKIIGALLAALRDVSLGGKPHVFNVPSDGTKTKPKDLTYSLAVSSTAAACMEVLIRSGKSTLQAKHFVIAELEKVKITHKSEFKAITAQTVEEWRYERRASRGTAAQSFYDELVNAYVAELGLDPNTPLAEELVRNAIQALSDSGVALSKIPGNPP